MRKLPTDINGSHRHPFQQHLHASSMRCSVNGLKSLLDLPFTFLLLLYSPSFGGFLLHFSFLLMFPTSLKQNQHSSLVSVLLCYKITIFLCGHCAPTMDVVHQQVVVENVISFIADDDAAVAAIHSHAHYSPFSNYQVFGCNLTLEFSRLAYSWAIYAKLQPQHFNSLLHN